MSSTYDPEYVNEKDGARTKANKFLIKEYNQSPQN